MGKVEAAARLAASGIWIQFEGKPAQGGRMAEKKTSLKPSRPRRKDLRGTTRRAREFADRLAAGDRSFSDSAETIRADRDSRL